MSETIGINRQSVLLAFLPIKITVLGSFYEGHVLSARPEETEKPHWTAVCLSSPRCYSRSSWFGNRYPCFQSSGIFSWKCHTDPKRASHIWNVLWASEKTGSKWLFPIPSYSVHDDLSIEEETWPQLSSNLKGMNKISNFLMLAYACILVQTHHWQDS